MDETVKLRRSIGPVFLTFYGLGNILGAGIYVLLGKIAAQAGFYIPVSFLVASVVVAFTALSYAELSARMPLSAGEAVYLHRAFGYRWLSVLVGVLIALAGILSAATISRGFVGYLNVFVDLPATLGIVALVLVLGAIAAWGISQSVGIAALITIVEIIGLLLVIGAGGHTLESLPRRFSEVAPNTEFVVWQGIVTGAFLAFYAYIGFEDMVNIAEEVKAPQRNMPRAIILALVISTILYLLVAVISVMAVSPRELAVSDAPLALVYERLTGRPSTIISVIAIFAVINGALIQMIMASRIFYGISHQGWLPSLLSRINEHTRTPLYSTALVVILILAFALWLPVVTLARVTSFIVLAVFVLVNSALVFVKGRDPYPPAVKVTPGWVPISGVVTCLGLVIFEVYSHLN